MITNRTMMHLLLSLWFIFASCEQNRNIESDQTSDSGPVQVDVPLENIRLPEGFEITVFALVENARSLTQSPSGTIYVGSRNAGHVVALRDNDQDGVAEKQYVIASGLNTPNGVAFSNGDLYVAEINRILKFSNIENQLDNPPDYEVVYDDYPKDRHHGWKFIAFGPDGRLYVPVGAPCNICESADIYASITSINPDGSDRRIFASGVRNTVGFTWHPDTREMWFTDNGRDWLGDNYPPCELNYAPRSGLHFGYPYCHGGDISDPEFGHKFPCSDFTRPAYNLGPHVAPLGLRFYTGEMFPENYHHNLIIAEHGSWNRSRKIGYRLMKVNIEDQQKATTYEVFAEGWLNEETQEAWGRPVDVEVLPDGSLLVSDDYANLVYRISYASD
jgi:glucose/arabinose dehydrogenase